MNELIPQIREKSYLAVSATSKVVGYLKIFYGNCELATRNVKLWYKDAVTRLQPNIAVLFCYLLGWVSGVILLFIKKEDSLVRFHAWQSIITFGILTVPIVVLNIV